MMQEENGRLIWEGDSLIELGGFCCAQVKSMPFNYRHKLLHFKFLHRLYYTLEHIAQFTLGHFVKCKKC